MKGEECFVKGKEIEMTTVPKVRPNWTGRCPERYLFPTVTIYELGQGKYKKSKRVIVLVLIARVFKETRLRCGFTGG